MKFSKEVKAKLIEQWKRINYAKPGSCLIDAPPVAIEVLDAFTEEVLERQAVSTMDEALKLKRALLKKCEKVLEEKYRAAGKDPDDAFVTARIVFRGGEVGVKSVANGFQQ